MEFQFRKATFGGFQRQDVVDYLEKISKDHSTQLEELKEKLTQFEEMEERAARLEEENATLQGERDTARGEVDSLQAKLKGAEGEIATLRQAELEAQEKIFSLTPDAEAFRSVKDRAAGMELEAHVRAQKTIDDGTQQANMMYNQGKQWLDQMKGEYGTTRGELDIAIAHALDGLKNAKGALEVLGQTMAQRDRAMEQVVSQWNKKLDKK